VQKIVIVGGVAGGATAAARLRRLDEQAKIVLFERGAHISYANCGLPYYIGDEITQESSLLLQSPQSFKDRFCVDVRVNHQVIALDPAAKTLNVKTAASETYSESYDKLILSPGAEPVRPKIEGLEADNVFTLRNVADAVNIKAYIREHSSKSAAIIGGGFIGLEMAENLRRLGLAVDVFDLEKVLPPIDKDMAQFVHAALLQNGVRLRFGQGVTNLAELKADIVLLAVGVRPDTKLAKDAGLKLNARGGIIVDKCMRTSDKDIFAVGDAVEIIDFVSGANAMIPLAGPANKQARIAADNICGIHSIYKGAQGSAVLRVFDLTVANTGMSETTAKRLNIDYDKVYTLSPSHAGYYPGASDVLLKTVFEKQTGKILGAQIIGGEGVDKRCDVLATAIRSGMTAYDLTELDLCYAPPYSSAKDPVNMVGYVIENLLTGKVKQFHWHDVADLPQDGSATFLDVRDESEYNAGSIKGFRNIALNNLRDNLSKLDKSKPVYITCGMGLRGYLAARILLQNGFDAYNLSGGVRFYKTITQLMECLAKS
jgi:NADPH-dependent 2,4-dienoyl-CoA reductase/sulfur reductase-like enzyme/rhodanese-related sulfurtransferase